MNINTLNNRLSAFVQKNSTTILCVLCFILSNMFLAIYMYPANCIIIGHDRQYHYLRVEALKYNIENNNLFSGVDYLYFGGGGYAGFAYPELFLFIPALLRVAGVGIGNSMSFFLILCNVFSYWFMFVFLRHISGSPICGTIGAVLYILSAYRIDNIIVRFALGEFQAFVFWPLILYGLYDFIFDEFKKPYIIGFGFVGMLLSHTISTAMALGFSVIISLIFIKRIIQAPGKIPKLLLTACCAVVVTTYYWLPLLELLFSCEMSVKNSEFKTVDSVMPFVWLFKEKIGAGIEGMKFPIFLMCILRVFLMRNSPVETASLRDNNTKKRKDILIIADTFMIIGIVLALSTTTLVSWKFLSKFLDFIQFPWRFFGPSTLLLIAAGTIYFYYIAEHTKATEYAVILLTTTAILITYVHIGIIGVSYKYPYDNDHYSDPSETYYVGMGEWLPRAANDNVEEILQTMGNTVLLSNNESVPCEREKGTLTFDLNENDIDFAELPYIWYKGYEAIDEHGNKLDISMSDNGLVQVDLREAAGRITVEHKLTRIRIVSYFISALAIVSLIILVIISRQKKRRIAAQIL